MSVIYLVLLSYKLETIGNNLKSHASQRRKEMHESK